MTQASIRFYFDNYREELCLSVGITKLWVTSIFDYKERERDSLYQFSPGSSFTMKKSHLNKLTDFQFLLKLVCVVIYNKNRFYLYR